MFDNKLQNTDADLHIKKIEKEVNGIKKIFYVDKQRNIYNNNSIIEKFENKKINISKIEMENIQMSAHTSLVKEFYSQGLKKLFTNFKGKVVEKDFTFDDALKVIMEENSKNKVKKSRKKSGKPRKKSGYNFFCEENKSKILDEVAKLQQNESEKKIKWFSVAGAMWKELAPDMKEPYEKKSKNL